MALAKKVKSHEDGPGFTGKAPGGPSRWNPDKSGDYIPLKHALVAEVIYDQVSSDRFRHGTKLLRWRPDKAPAQCTRDQLIHEVKPAELLELVGRLPSEHRHENHLSQAHVIERTANHE